MGRAQAVEAAFGAVRRIVQQDQVFMRFSFEVGVEQRVRFLSQPEEHAAGDEHGGRDEPEGGLRRPRQAGGQP